MFWKIISKVSLLSKKRYAGFLMFGIYSIIESFIPKINIRLSIAFGINPNCDINYGLALETDNK
jgi:hypothetical protein